jgi:hypothetical protein
MFGIRAQDIQGQTVRPAPFGVEGDPKPRLVWDDPNPKAMIPNCMVQDGDKRVTADNIEGLKALAMRLGLVCNDDAYVP